MKSTGSSPFIDNNNTKYSNANHYFNFLTFIQTAGFLGFLELGWGFFCKSLHRTHIVKQRIQNASTHPCHCCISPDLFTKEQISLQIYGVWKKAISENLICIIQVSPFKSKCCLLSQKSNKIEVVLLGGHSHCNGEKGQNHLVLLKKEKYLQSRSLPNT